MYSPGYESVLDLVQTEVDQERGYAFGRERALLIALLGDGIQSLFAPKNKRNAQRIREAHAWIVCADTEYVFSFENVCEALGINAACLRSALMRSVAMQAAGS